MSTYDSLSARLERLAGEVRPLRPRHDVEPVPSVAPRDVDQTRELLRFAARERLRVIPCGLGSKLSWCGIPGHVDFMLSTRCLTRVVSHVPDDGTLTIEAGATMAELKERCRAGGHFLTPDVARAATKTIGGVVAAGESGLDRLRFGPVRHHVLGLAVVLSDGSLARTGGRLVKNVTGFDLQRLYCGSHGTLCTIVEVSLRLFPEPEHELWLSTGVATLQDALGLAAATLNSPARVVSLSIAEMAPPKQGQAWAVFARLFGRRAAVEAERALLARSWPVHASCEGARAREAAEQMSDALTFSSSPHPTLHVSCRPSRALGVTELVRVALERLGIERRLALQPGLAELDVELRGPLEPQALAGLVRELRVALREQAAQLALRNAPRAALLDIDPFGERGPGLELMRALQRQLDAAGVYSTGRFHGGL